MKSNIGNTVIETESFIKQAAARWSAAESTIRRITSPATPLPAMRCPARAACESYGGAGTAWGSEAGRG